MKQGEKEGQSQAGWSSWRESQSRDWSWTFREGSSSGTQNQAGAWWGRAKNRPRSTSKDTRASSSRMEDQAGARWGSAKNRPRSTSKDTRTSLSEVPPSPGGSLVSPSQDQARARSPQPKSRPRPSSRDRSAPVVPKAEGEARASSAPVRQGAARGGIGPPPPLPPEYAQRMNDAQMNAMREKMRQRAFAQAKNEASEHR